MAALLRQLEGLARRQPVLMIFEDAHWIDPTSHELLDLTVERVRSLPAALIVTFRPEFQPPWVVIVPKNHNIKGANVANRWHAGDVLIFGLHRQAKDGATRRSLFHDHKSLIFVTRAPRGGLKGAAGAAGNSGQEPIYGSSNTVPFSS